MKAMLKWSLAATLLMTGGTAMAIEEPVYDVLATTKYYEIRRYEPYIVAEVDVDGNLRQSGNSAFRILAGYIFGDNQPNEKMAMTAPVKSRPNDGGLKMNMTAPVTTDAPAGGRGSYTYAFVMERKYTMDTLPKPNDARVRLREMPPRTMAVRRFSGMWTDGKMEAEESRLITALATDRIETLGELVLARYNGPMTPPFLRRNEIMVEVEWPRALAPLADE